MLVAWSTFSVTDERITNIHKDVKEFEVSQSRKKFKARADGGALGKAVEFLGVSGADFGIALTRLYIVPKPLALPLLATNYSVTQTAKVKSPKET